MPNVHPSKSTDLYKSHVIFLQESACHAGMTSYDHFNLKPCVVSRKNISHPICSKTLRLWPSCTCWWHNQNCPWRPRGLGYVDPAWNRASEMLRFIICLPQEFNRNNKRKSPVVMLPGRCANKCFEDDPRRTDYLLSVNLIMHIHQSTRLNHLRIYWSTSEFIAAQIEASAVSIKNTRYPHHMWRKNIYVTYCVYI